MGVLLMRRWWLLWIIVNEVTLGASGFSLRVMN